ncbi:hypothetical protein ACTFRN_09445 [Bacillus cereus group sp. MYBK245-2]|uniref:Uncharacterized protein n=1 Tax=Bacillus pacificus TaxID=2026187 RepID=A0A1Y5ZEL7_9BACI|nr:MULTISPECIES: hypothetical protein [Bacillus cereus group]ONG85829.1 hypothetical protein BKK40_27810 [Bacillus cereus]MDA1507900.1 hypothetical protein [Bacillus cereus group sp. TH36-2LC]MDA1576291.1 hypothetical protein [Bacillus cereus group sp. TH242-3LC]MDA1828935.1 hypothetical protein [Bacillus cereus group sp. BY25LC]MDA1895087.1 hypothetical protein [Bacillus cereus group sp. BcHK28]
MKLLTLNTGIRNTQYSDVESLLKFFEGAKNYGILFYTADLKSLPLNEPFHIYHYSRKGSGGYQLAFPIPSALYHSLKINHYSLKWLNVFYQLYYQDTPPPPWQWKYWDTYIGENYVWIYKTE